MSFCPQCRSPLDPNARFCTNCGYTLPAPPAGPRPFAGGPAPYGAPQAPGYGPPPGPPGYGPPPGGGYGAPPGPPGYGPAPVPPPANDEGGGMKVLGGCGLAGCIGAVVAVMVGIGLIMVLVMLAGGSSSSSGSSGGGDPSSGPGGDVPTEGSVRSLLRQQVGAYRLASTTPLEKVPQGAIDSIGAIYTSPSGGKVFHILLVYPTESIASARIEAVWRSSLSELKPGQKVNRGNVKDASGNIRGTIVAVTGGNPESFYWNNRKLVVIVEGAPPHAKAFESSAPY
jgi:hypothetical protein